MAPMGPPCPADERPSRLSVVAELRDLGRTTPEPTQSAVAGAGPVMGPHPTFVGCKGSDCTVGSGIAAESVLFCAETMSLRAELIEQSIVTISAGVCSESRNGFMSM
ncbi:hypothetical protein B0A48_09401 [Cryoendolithus antarcticus]|uniref:Uncharacterized protein n=1 Tax=Cryoendolithus antarcticus TaxID=1507870 RepID=A0A1V8SZG8_9PEZI|nr:hypothetical protein B0A48_09401 [Cryoendolithus antarcticus]